MKPILIVLLAVLLGGPALAQPTGTGSDAKTLFSRLHPEDQRLAEGWQDGLATLLDEVRETSDDPETLAAIPEFAALIAAPHLPFALDDLEGDWRMRSLQATDYGAFIYQYFPARIYREDGAYVFDKDSGSQRHRGLLAQKDATSAFFVGALYYGYEAPRLYSAMTLGETTPEQREFDAVAEIYRIGEEHFLMAFAPEDGRYRLYEIRR